MTPPVAIVSVLVDLAPRVAVRWECDGTFACFSTAASSGWHAGDVAAGEDVAARAAGPARRAIAAAAVSVVATVLRQLCEVLDMGAPPKSATAVNRICP